MNDPNLIVQTLDKAQRDFILREDEGGDPVPMALNHLSKFLIRIEPLPLQGRSPVVKELLSLALFFIFPKLAEGFL